MHDGEIHHAIYTKTEDTLNSLPAFNCHSFVEIGMVRCLKVIHLNLLQSGMILCEGWFDKIVIVGLKR